MMKKDIAHDPADICLRGSIAVVLQAQHVTHLVEQFFRFVSHDATPTVRTMHDIIVLWESDW